MPSPTAMPEAGAWCCCATAASAGPAGRNAPAPGRRTGRGSPPGAWAAPIRRWACKTPGAAWRPPWPGTPRRSSCPVWNFCRHTPRKRYPCWRHRGCAGSLWPRICWGTGNTPLWKWRKCWPTSPPPRRAWKCGWRKAWARMYASPNWCGAALPPCRMTPGGRPPPASRWASCWSRRERRRSMTTAGGCGNWANG